MYSEIQLLRQEIERLKLNEREYQDLEFLFQDLELRYSNLVSEKDRVENDLKNRIDINQKIIQVTLKSL